METAKKVAVLVEGPGLPGLEEVQVKPGALLREVAEAIAAKCGFAPEEALLFVEDEDEPVALDRVLDDKYDHKRIHNVHRKKQIEVVVFYESKEKKHPFSPATRVSKVLAWSVSMEGFNIAPNIAPEMRLQLFGQTGYLPPDAHIGRYVSHHEHVLKLNLVRTIIPNG